jgi:hypothetical protein
MPDPVMRPMAIYAAGAVLRQMRAEGKPATAEALLALWRRTMPAGEAVHAGLLFVADGRSPCANAQAIGGEIDEEMIDFAVVVECEPSCDA